MKCALFILRYGGKFVETRSISWNLSRFLLKSELLSRYPSCHPLSFPNLCKDTGSGILKTCLKWEAFVEAKKVCFFSPRDMCGCEVRWCEPVSQHENEAAYMILRSSFCSMWDNDTKGGILSTDRYSRIQYATCRMIS